MLKLFLGVFLLISSLTTHVSAQESAVSQERIGDWVVTCPKEESKSKQCVMAQEITVDQNGVKGRLASFVLFKDQSDGKIKGRFAVPLGVYLLDGLFFRVDEGKPYKTNIAVCKQQGCMDALAFKDGLISEFKAGGTLSVYYSVKPGKKMETKMSLKGFTKAYGKTFN